jgi:hypothetical protein
VGSKERAGLDILWKVRLCLQNLLTVSASFAELSFQDLTIAFDRRGKGFIELTINGRAFEKTAVGLLKTPRIALDTWINARAASELDGGFRGTFQSLQFSSVVAAQGSDSLGSGNTTTLAARYAMSWHLYLVPLIVGFFIVRFRSRCRRWAQTSLRSLRRVA